MPAPESKKSQTPKQSSQKQSTNTPAKQSKGVLRPLPKAAPLGSADTSATKAKEGLNAASLEGTHPADWKEELLSQVAWFETTSTELTLTFPSNLSASQRRFLHEIADSKGLGHTSVGEGDDRRIILEKKRPLNDAQVFAATPRVHIVKVNKQYYCFNILKLFSILGR